MCIRKYISYHPLEVYGSNRPLVSQIVRSRVMSLPVLVDAGSSPFLFLALKHQVVFIEAPALRSLFINSTSCVYTAALPHLNLPHTSLMLWELHLCFVSIYKSSVMQPLRSGRPGAARLARVLCALELESLQESGENALITVRPPAVPR